MKTATADEVQEIALVQLDPHPRNTHGKLSADHPKVQELKASIQATRQNEPCLVRPKESGRFEILSGHIRTFVQELLGAETVPCLVREVDDETALAILITSNEKEPVDPLLEADAIAELMKTKEGGLKAVAETLGKTVRYVAMRANLTTLTEKVRKLWSDGKLPAFTIPMLEDVALLSAETQDRLAGAGGELYYENLKNVNSKATLDRLIGEQLHELGKATWDLADAKLCPKAGSCVECPKTSLRAPGLFGELVADPADPKALKTAVCRDSICWTKKRDAVTKAKIVELKKENPGAVLAKEGHRVPIPAGMKPEIDVGYHSPKVGAKTKGAQPVVIVNDQGEVSLGHVKPRKSGSSSAAKKPKKAKAEKAPKPTDKNFADRVEASKKEVADRRAALVPELLMKEFGRYEKNPLMFDGSNDVLDGLVFAIGLHEPAYEHKCKDELARRKALYELGLKGSGRDIAKEIVPRLIIALTDSIDADPALDRWVAELLGINLAELEAEAAKEIPDEKWWGPASPLAGIAQHAHGKLGKTLCGISFAKSATNVFVADKKSDVTCEGCKKKAKK